MPTPLQSHTLADSNFNEKYSWSKAPRYMDMAAEAGPLARVLMNANPDNLLPHQVYDPLFGDVIEKLGTNVFTRTLARVHEAARLYTQIDEWLRQVDLNDEFYIKPEERDGKGFGATEAARGALAHWIEIEDGVIKNYQVMAPTTWNVGPNDDKGNPGPIEAALEGTEIEIRTIPSKLVWSPVRSTPVWFALSMPTMGNRARKWLNLNFNRLMER